MCYTEFVGGGNMSIFDFKSIDTTFDFTTDTPHYWDNFWEGEDSLGVGGNDPDTLSKTLRRYHQILWSRELPNGEIMELSASKGTDYLVWKEYRFGSDSIAASFRYKKYKSMLQKIEQALPDYKGFVEDFLRQAYTIGGEIIFPKRRSGSINQNRGCNPQIRDRWDLTLECIRKYYLNESSPLYDTLKNEKAFFDLFVDFKGYVDFFFLEDCVSSDYQSVNLWLGNGEFTYNPLPETVEDYLSWIARNLEFVRKRNQRIQDYCSHL